MSNTNKWQTTEMVVKTCRFLLFILLTNRSHITSHLPFYCVAKQSNSKIKEILLILEEFLFLFICDIKEFFFLEFTFYVPMLSHYFL